MIVPVGSVEQHGPHLPLDTDTRIASEIAARLAAADDTALVAPAIAYGASGEHAGFAGTVSIGLAALELLILEYGRSVCDWASRVVFVNGHGGNAHAIAAAVVTLRSEGRDAAWLPCVVAGDAHAGLTETSILLHLCPEVVRFDRAVAGNSEPVSTLMSRLRSGGIVSVSRSGVLGDPTRASAEYGLRLLTDMHRRAHECYRRWTPGSEGRLE